MKISNIDCIIEIKGFEMGKWTNAGFVANSIEYYKNQLQQVFINAYGSDFLLDDSLPQGVVIQEIAELLYNADMDGVEALARLNLNTATGIYLDLIGALRGIPRRIGVPPMLTVTITSDSSSLPYTIPAGHEVTIIETGEVFTIQQAVTVSTASLAVTVVGSAYQATTTQVGHKGTSSISNITDITVTGITPGVDAEPDYEFRTRLLQTYTVMNGTMQSVLNLLRNRTDIRSVGVNYNDTSSTVSSIPAYCTEFMVVPKEEANLSDVKQAVANIIVQNKTPGAPTYGNVTQNGVDPNGKTVQVNFTIPTKKAIEIVVTVSTPETTGVLDLTHVPEIQTAIVKYINSLGIGQDVSFARCMAPLTADTGFDVVSFQIKATGDQSYLTNANYPIGVREYASGLEANISIGV